MHIQTIYKLNELRTIINDSRDTSIIMQTALQAIELTEHIETKKEGKERILHLLKSEIRTYTNSHIEIEVIQFQVASTLLMLGLQFIEGTIDDMIAMLIEFAKKAA